MPLISPGSSHCNPSLHVSLRYLMSGISQQGLAASRKLGTMAVVLILIMTEKVDA